MYLGGVFMLVDFFDCLVEHPVIATINDTENLDKALNSPCKIIFLLSGNIFNLEYIVNKVNDKNKSIYIHIDAIDGFSKDVVALRYITRNIRPQGIITAKDSLIKYAKDMSIFAIQRIYLSDSHSIDVGIRIARATRPNVIEVLPGVIPKATKTIKDSVNIPLIAGGLMMDKNDIMKSIDAGAIGVSTSKENLWHIRDFR